MQVSNPNRFFGMNPVSAPNQGKREGIWSHDLPRSWRDAIEADGKTPAAEAPAPEEGDEAA